MKTRVLLIAVLSATTLAACGGDDEEAPVPADEGGGGSSLSITALEPFAFDPTSLNAPAGEVTITMESASDLQAPHAVSIDGNGVDEGGEVVDPGGTSTVTAELDAGEYSYYCPVGNHRADGMEGTLTVG